MGHFVSHPAMLHLVLFEVMNLAACISKERVPFKHYDTFSLSEHYDALILVQCFLSNTYVSVPYSKIHRMLP